MLPMHRRGRESAPHSFTPASAETISKASLAWPGTDRVVQLALAALAMDRSNDKEEACNNDNNENTVLALRSAVRNMDCAALWSAMQQASASSNSNSSSSSLDFRADSCKTVLLSTSTNRCCGLATWKSLLI